MNIICLNIWGGRAGRELVVPFFEKYRDTTDVFCLQEVWAGLYDDLEGVPAGGRHITQAKTMTYALQEIGEVLPDHVPYFRPHFRDHYGLCMFVRKGLEVIEEGEVFVYKTKDHQPAPGEDVGTHARNIQFITLNDDGISKTVINFHGLWNGQGKGDSEDRLLQSENILNFIQGLGHPLVFCGDFNLKPDTASLQKFEAHGLRNLIKEHQILSTRTSFYDKPQDIADYVFVSEGVEVLDFKVLPEEVSDHAALYIKIA